MQQHRKSPLPRKPLKSLRLKKAQSRTSKRR
jgi:hypothetical protein